jgi:CheY-like chemotaxis protein
MGVWSINMNSSPLHVAKNGTKLILSVDDEPGILQSRQLILESEGYEVLSAADGEQALQMFAEQPVDLVLLDYVMPGMNGGVVAQKIKNDNPRVPVIIVSASPVVEERSLGCVDCFISKGEGPVVLLVKIKQLLAPVSTPAIRAARSPGN